MSKAPPQLEFKIHGMDCAEEVALLQKEVGPVVGGKERLSFNLLNATMTVLQAPAADAQMIQTAVARLGLRAELLTGEAGLTQQHNHAPQGRTLLTAASGICGLLGFIAHALWEGDQGATNPFC